jgi:hypothetical protein
MPLRLPLSQVVVVVAAVLAVPAAMLWVAMVASEAQALAAPAATLPSNLRIASQH